MSNQTNKDPMDEALRKALGSIEPAYDPGDWNDLEKKLDERDRNNKKGFFRWSTLMVMIFAVMSIVAATYFFSSDYIQNNTGENTLTQNDTNEKTTVNSTTGEKENIKAEPTITNQLENESQDNESSDPGENRLEEANSAEYKSDEEKSHQPVIDRSGTSKAEKSPVKIQASNPAEPAAKKNSGVKAGKPGISGVKNQEREIVANPQPSSASVPAVKSIGHPTEKTINASPVSNPFKKSPVTKKQNGNQSTLAGLQRKQTLSEPVKEILPGEEKKMDDVLQKNDSSSAAPAAPLVNSEQSLQLAASDKKSESAEVVKDSSETANADSAKEVENSTTTVAPAKPKKKKSMSPAQTTSQTILVNFWNNPSYTGLGEKHTITVFYRSRWTKSNHHPQAFWGGYDAALGKKKNNSVGIWYNNAITGFFVRSVYALSYAKKITIKQEHQLRVGTSFSFSTIGHALDSLTFPDMIDPRYGFIYNTSEFGLREMNNNFDLNAGLFYSFRNFYAGLAALHLIEPDESFIGGKPAVLPLEFNGNIGYGFTMNYDYKITPSLIFRSIPASKIRLYSPAVSFSYKQDLVFGGISYLNLNTLTIFAGYKPNKRSQVYAAWGYPTDKIMRQFGNTGLAEVSLRFFIGKQKK